MHSAFAVMPQGRVSWETRVGDTPLEVNGGLNGRSGLEGISHEGDAGLDVASLGLFRFTGSYKRIGHSFAVDAKSLYSGIGTGVLTFTDPTLQPTMTAVSATNYKTSTLQKYVDSADLVNLGLRRDIVNLGVEVSAAEPLTLGVAFMGEQRRGSRPFWACFGMGNSVEIAEPIDYDTFDVSTNVGYAETVPLAGGIPVVAEVTAAHSGFRNNIPNLVFGNPGGAVSMSNTYSGLPLAGSVSLEPSNAADRVGASVSAMLPHHVGVSGHASVARMTQNMVLPAMSINPDRPFAPPSQLTAGMKVYQSFYDTSVAYSPVRRVHVKLRASYRQHDNRSPSFVRPAPWINYDSSVSTVSATSHAVSSIERTYEFEQVFDVSHRTRITSIFEHERASFINGSADAMRTNAFKLAVDTRVADWAMVRASGLHAVRDSAYPDYRLVNAELPWERKYYAADRDRDQLTLMASAMASEDLDITVEHREGLDDYKHSLFGMSRDRSQASTVDVTWGAGDGVSVNTFVSQEQYVTNQRSRQWNPDTATAPGSGNPYSASPTPEDPGNWTIESTTVVRTIGTRTDLQLVPETLSMRIEGTASVANGKLDYESPLSATLPLDSNMWLPNDVNASDETKSINAGVSVRYQVTKAIWASLAYRYDLWQIRDDNLDGYSPVAVNWANAYNGMVNMDALWKNYEVHTVLASVGMSF